MERLACLDNVADRAIRAAPREDPLFGNDAYGSGLSGVIDQVDVDVRPPHEGASRLAQRVEVFDRYDLDPDDLECSKDIATIAPDLTKISCPEGKRLFWGAGSETDVTFEVEDEMGARLGVEGNVYCVVVVAAKDEQAVLFAFGLTPGQLTEAGRKEKEGRDQEILALLRETMGKARDLIDEEQIVTMWREEARVRDVMES